MPPVSYSRNVTLPTLLANASLDIKIVQFARRHPLPWHKAPVYGTAMLAAGQPVALLDVPTRNGAVHVVSKLLNPMKHGKPHHGPPEGPAEDEGLWLNGFESDGEDEDGEWAGWEEWLPRWAAEN